MGRKYISVFLVIVMLVVAFAGCTSNEVQIKVYNWEDNGDVEIMRDRMRNDLYDKEIDPSQQLSDLQKDGSFKSVDYYSEKQDTWHPIEHLENVLKMTKAAYSPENKWYMNEELINGINSALRFWSDKGFYCDWNWWHNDIGKVAVLKDIMLFEHKGLEEEYVNKLIGELEGASLKDEVKPKKVKERTVESTGGNLTDKVVSNMTVAVIKGDGETLMYLRDLMINEIRVFPNHKLFAHKYDLEGIKADMSFQQHFDLLYLGGYGEVFCDGVNTYLKYTEGTQFALPEENINNYADFIIDGMQYAMRGEYRDINASGRGIVRNDGLYGIHNQVMEACNILLQYPETERKEDLQYIVENRTAENDKGAGGHKYFWTSDYQVYNGSGYMATVRSASKRTKNSEALNGENVLGHYLGAGATMFNVYGDEYFGIMPLWNWNRIPGTTTLQGYLPVGGDETYTRMGKTSFVGGVSNGKEGMSCLDYNDNSVKAKKAWFMFDEGVVCLGAGITSRKGEEVYTCINQTKLTDGALAFMNGKETDVKTGISSLSGDMKWVYNNSVGYISSSPLVVTAEHRSGDITKISTREQSKIYSGNIFEIGISHGVKPKDASYDYTVLMNTTPEKTALYSENPVIKTLSNTEKIQAVWHSEDKMLQAVFYKAGELSLPNGEVIKVNKPCTLMYCAGENKEIYVGNPDQKSRTIKVSLDDKEYRAEFEKGLYGGMPQKVL